MYQSTPCLFCLTFDVSHHSYWNNCNNTTVSNSFHCSQICWGIMRSSGVSIIWTLSSESQSFSLCQELPLWRLLLCRRQRVFVLRYLRLRHGMRSQKRSHQLEAAGLLRYVNVIPNHCDNNVKLGIIADPWHLCSCCTLDVWPLG